MKSNKASSGTIVKDPASTLPIGSTINFQSILLQHSPTQTAAWINDWESLDGILLGIAFTDKISHRLEGSAVLVAPGIALCASHVVEPRIKAIMAGQESITCMSITKAGLQVWAVRKITTVPNSDLTILGLALSTKIESSETLFKSEISTRLPKIGEQVSIFGFRALHATFPRTTSLETMFLANVLVCSGSIVERYPTGRDRVMIPWPALEIACPSWGGMSGGPVFDSSGKVIGLLSSSFETADNQGPSYVSLLFPALTAQFEGGWPEPLFRAPTTLFEMDPRLCSIDRRDAIRRHVDRISGKVTTNIIIWE